MTDKKFSYCWQNARQHAHLYLQLEIRRQIQVQCILFLIRGENFGEMEIHFSYIFTAHVQNTLYFYFRSQIKSDAISFGLASAHQISYAV